MISRALPGPLVCLCGPTATGKSSLADKLAHTLKSAVISVDAMQVYRGMDIGTAKMPAQQRRSPLYMVDIVDVTDEFSVADFQKQARSIIDDLLEEGRLPVLCGGTGLYLDAVIDEMDFPAGGRMTEQRRAFEELAQTAGPKALHALLAKQDPASAACIHPHNTRRVIRALELAEQGRSYARRTEQGLKAHKPHYRYHIWALVLPREELYARIDARVDAMLQEGLLDEVRALDSHTSLSESPTAAQAIGYKELLAYLHGESSLDEATAAIKRATKRYAKRQLSWIRRDGRADILDLSQMSEDDALEIILGSIDTDCKTEGVYEAE